jgi:hypothetical protein
VSSAIRWCARLRETGAVGRDRLGGDRRWGRIEAHAVLFLEQVACKPDLMLAELRAARAASGVAAGIATPWRFLDRHGLTLNNRRMRLSRTAPTP